MRIGTSPACTRGSARSNGGRPSRDDGSVEQSGNQTAASVPSSNPATQATTAASAAEPVVAPRYRMTISGCSRISAGSAHGRQRNGLREAQTFRVLGRWIEIPAGGVRTVVPGNRGRLVRELRTGQPGPPAEIPVLTAISDELLVEPAGRLPQPAIHAEDRGDHQPEVLVGRGPEVVGAPIAVEQPLRVVEQSYRARVRRGDPRRYASCSAGAACPRSACRRRPTTNAPCPSSIDRSRRVIADR